MKIAELAVLAMVMPALAGCSLSEKQGRPANACQSDEGPACTDMQDHSNGGPGNGGSHGGSAGGGMGGGM